MEGEMRKTKKPGSPCLCLGVAGMLNYTQKNKPIADCQICDGTGLMKERLSKVPDDLVERRAELNWLLNQKILAEQYGEWPWRKYDEKMYKRIRSLLQSRQPEKPIGTKDELALIENLADIDWLTEEDMICLKSINEKLGGIEK